MPLTEERRAFFTLLLGHGVYLPLSGTWSIREWLTRDIGLPESRLNDLATIFRNGLALDGLESECIHPGDTLALAGPMPGMVGIALGRNSPIKALRYDAARPAPTGCEHDVPEGCIKVKVFSQAAAFLLPLLLKRGFSARQTLFGRLLERYPEAALPVPAARTNDMVLFISGNPENRLIAEKNDGD